MANLFALDTTLPAFGTIKSRSAQKTKSHANFRRDRRTRRQGGTDAGGFGQPRAACWGNSFRTSEVRRSSTKPLAWSLLTTLAICAAASVARAQEAAPVAPPAADQAPKGNAGGHLGVAVPLVTVTDEETTTVSDQFTLAHPIGVGVKVSRRLTVDFEVVVSNPIDPVGPTGLVIDPGVVYDLGPVALGLRAAFQIGQTANIGAVPLVNKGLVDLGGATWFIEAAFPTFYSDHDVAFNVVLHTGIGF
jgi:hypothetical protein